MISVGGDVVGAGDRAGSQVAAGGDEQAASSAVVTLRSATHGLVRFTIRGYGHKAQRNSHGTPNWADYPRSR